MYGNKDEVRCKVVSYCSLLTTDPFLLAILPITMDRFVATILPFK